MIEFKQKYYSEYDAMKSFYEELKKYSRMNRAFPKVDIIDSSALIPVLRGNNIVIERFVISTSFGSKDKYRMYLKVGARAKMPDEVRLPSESRERRLMNLNLKFNSSMPNRKFFSDQQEGDLRIKLFGKNRNNNNNGGGGGNNLISSEIKLDPELTYIEKELKGKTLSYDKKESSLVLEFDSIDSAIKSLTILPFGLNYNIYLLDA